MAEFEKLELIVTLHDRDEYKKVMFWLSSWSHTIAFTSNLTEKGAYQITVSGFGALRPGDTLDDRTRFIRGLAKLDQILAATSLPTVNEELLKDDSPKKS